jgi:hypothetical protein
MMIKNDGNKNIMEREKYTVKSAGVPLFSNFSNFSNIDIFEYIHSRFGTIELNGIIPECECTGCLD